MARTAPERAPDERLVVIGRRQASAQRDARLTRVVRGQIAHVAIGRLDTAIGEPGDQPVVIAARQLTELSGEQREPDPGTRSAECTEVIGAFTVEAGPVDLTPG